MSSTEETHPPKEEEADPPKEEEADPPKEKEADIPKEEETDIPKEEVTSDAAQEEDSIKNIKSLVHDTKLEGGKSLWATTLETFGMADGKGKKGDVLADTEEEAVESIKSMLAACKDEAPKWQFTLTPLEQFNATLDDVLRAFVLWAKNDDEPIYNISKAFRRLDSYATWMEDHRSVLEAPLVVDSLTVAAHAWQCKLTHDAKDRLVWWIDVGALDIPSIKSSIPHDDSLRFFVWQSHLVMFDKKAQENGIILAQSMGEKGMIETMTMVPMSLGTKLDRLTIGTLPVKMQVFYIFNHKRWLGILMGMLKPFLSKKMRQRIVTIPRNQDPQTVMDKEIGRDFIPVGFAGLEGKAEDDIVFGQYIK
eukprot:CAMPEP_0119022402 /NCGR_PEP_ID=MMETSP1176-20130426/27935_1 /TAXON_ID=265551 /ORGANISM="Synedropsis recta cf, Strain CCMP1620" /LENGTH=363 /DNA_ID=CAMNT_0006977253 /DNA_START=113 /DNA_END=1204 /DNA_ORIENTATION=+